MRRRPLVPLAAGALAAGALAACGGSPGTLLAVDRSGEIPGAELRVVIEDGGLARCDDGEARRLPDELLLEARAIERDLEPAAAEGLALEPGPRSILRYDVQTPTGDVRFADTSPGRVAGMDELAYLVRRVAQDVCGLER
jgi:hypothetical protein